jgi:allophanate hydrolase
MTLIDQPFDIGRLQEAYTEGLSPKQTVELVFDRLEAANDPGIFIHVANKNALLAKAEALDPSRRENLPLWGIPFAVKDNIDVAGMPTTAACPDFSYVADEDATSVRLLTEAGALVVGKTNLDQFATGLVGLRTPYPVPTNTIDPALVPGGSSSGSAVAVARGIVSFALGTDTAGSGRIPAGLNNVVGLKPSLGAISTTGVIPACRTLDCVSIFAMTVDDAYTVFEQIARPDPSDPYSRTIAVGSGPSRPPVLKLGVPATDDLSFFDDHAMRDGFEAALHALGALGCQIEEIPFADFYATARLLYEGAWIAERYAAISDFIESHESSLHPVTRQIITGARKLSAVDAFKGLYALQAFKARVAPILDSVDLVCVPTAPTHYKVEAVANDPIGTNSRLGTYTNFVNLLDLCGMAVPAGWRRDGLPMSVTLLAPAGLDATVAGLARDLQAAANCPLGATDWQLPAASMKPDDGNGESTIDLVVIGAHLSGMPLNAELTAAGARFWRKGKTAPCYRLYALAGQAVPKPGLVRASNKQGAMIDIEVWRLNPGAFGQFVANIPPPLTIGTISLFDGTTAKGFLVEPAGLENAVDITEYGGWRNFAATNMSA